MTEHWNIQISIQRVVKTVTPAGGIRHTSQVDREVSKVLEMAVSADSEAEAYAKAARIMEANQTPTNLLPEDVELGPIQKPRLQ